MPQTANTNGADAADPARPEHFDVLIVGAGLSGICAACHLQARFPQKRIGILEGRDAIGGTWDLFRYPGVRSDSDMFTLGYSFRRWRGEKSIADGAAICAYIRDTAKEFGIDRQIRFRHRVTQASWSSPEALWSVAVEVAADRSPTRFTARFLFMCSGYYDYESGYLPSWPGREDYGGKLIHPQHWPAGLNYRDQRVVVIGSGATAVTLVPAMAEQAAHVTLLQRSPSYIVARPSSDKMAHWLRKCLPDSLTHALVRWKNIFLGVYFFSLARRRPALVKRLIFKGVQRSLGPAYDAAPHFTPAYNPWQQRLCLVPDADLFKAIRSEKVAVVTDEIATFTRSGLRLRSGRHLEADLVVAATVLRVRLFGGTEIRVDGVQIDISEALSYKGLMFSDIPNFASVFGYANASWTLKCELSVKYVCRLLQYLDDHDFGWCVPRRQAGDIAAMPALDFSSGYVQRASKALPKQGARLPWRVYQNYFMDIIAMKFSSMNDGVMQFERHGSKPSKA